MEITNPSDRPQGAFRPQPRHLYLGLALMAVGAVWMLYNFDVIGYRFFDVFFSWEMLLIVLGGYLLTLKRWTVGGIVAAVGAFFLLTDLLHLHIPFDKVILPALCILIGLAVILTPRRR